jgi:uncharacterized membrane protein
MPRLVIGLLVFFGVHSIAIVAPAWRDRMDARLGHNAWRGIYSVLSIVGFVLIISGYGLARMTPTVLYSPPHWLHYLSAVLMLPVFPLLIAAYLPSRLGTFARHPLLAATKFWALAHLLTNGTVADVLLFGSFLVWAVADRISLKHRPPKAIPALPASKANDAIAILVGLALYALFLTGLHARLFGVAPLVW